MNKTFEFLRNEQASGKIKRIRFERDWIRTSDCDANAGYYQYGVKVYWTDCHSPLFYSFEELGRED